MKHTIILMKDWDTKIIRQNRELNYSQNDTVIVIMNGKTEIVDKRSFLDMLVNATQEFDFARHLLTYFGYNKDGEVREAVSCPHCERFTTGMINCTFCGHPLGE